MRVETLDTRRQRSDLRKGKNKGHTESEKSCMFQDFFERSEWEKDTESVIWKTIGGQAREVPLCPRRCCSQSYSIKQIPYHSSTYRFTHLPTYPYSPLEVQP